MSPITINEGDNYFMRGTCADIGAFSIVTIEWNHPNYGYFADMLQIKSLHIEEWKSFPIVSGSEKYTLDSFLKKYPNFTSLFDERDIFDYVMKE